MNIRTLKYHIEEGVSGIFKNGLMSAASIATVAACAFILVVSLCIVLNIDYVLEQFESDVGISVFIGDDVSDLQLDEIDAALRKISNVREVEYVSKEDALKYAKDTMDDGSGILDGLENDNPLPRSFRITLRDPKAQKQVIEDLENLQRKVEIDVIKNKYHIDKNLSVEMIQKDEENEEIDIDSKGFENKKNALDEISRMEDYGYKFMGIENIRHMQEETEILIMISTVMRVASVILVLVMCLVAVAIIMNTIKLTVFIRKNEISIMKYVGATDWFIRWPFMIEGLIIGLVGALIPLVICALGYKEILVMINTQMQMLTSIAELKETGALFSVIAPATIILGMTLGALGSITSMRQYLDV